MATRSNFSPKALSESRANDRKAKYNDDFGIHGGSINWSSLSDPVYSKEVSGPDGKKYIVVRQTGYGSTPIGRHWTSEGEKETFPLIGVQRYFRIFPDGSIGPDSDFIPEVIRFKGNAAPASYGKTSFDTHMIPKKDAGPKDKKYITIKTWNKKDLLRDWADMIKDKDTIPDISTMPLLERTQVSRYDDYINEDADEDLANYHSGAGAFLTRDNYAEEKHKREMASIKDTDSDINNNNEPDMFEPKEALDNKPKVIVHKKSDNKPKVIVHKKSDNKQARIDELKRQIAELEGSLEVSDVCTKDLDCPMYYDSCDRITNAYKDKLTMGNIISALDRRF